MAAYTSPRYILFGKLTRDFYILPDNRAVLDVPGGDLLYAAIGLILWEPDPPPGIVARVGREFPQEWLELFRNRGIDPRGIRTDVEEIDLRSFFIYQDQFTRLEDDPVSYFARSGHKFPRALLGYRVPRKQVDSRTRMSQVSIRQSDIFPDYFNATSAHICATDYLTQTHIPAVLRQNGFTTITLDPSPGMMTPVFWDDIPSVLTGLTAFLPSEEELMNLFVGRSADVWEMADELSSYGCEFVVIKRGKVGQYLFDSSNRTRWEIPSYPSRLVNLYGAGAAFCGGFLAGYRKTFDPLQAVLHGNISASMVVEGDDPFYALDALPGLADARYTALKETVRRI